MTRKPRATRRGVAIITVILVLSILSVIGLGMATIGSGQLGAAGLQPQLAYAAADAGLAAIEAWYAQSTSYGGPDVVNDVHAPPNSGSPSGQQWAWPAAGPTQLASNSRLWYKVDVTVGPYKTGSQTVPPPNGTVVYPGFTYYLVTGYVDYHGPTSYTAMKQVGAYVHRAAGLYQYPIQGDYTIQINNGSTRSYVDQWDGSQGPLGGGLPYYNQAADVSSMAKGDQGSMNPAAQNVGGRNFFFISTPNFTQVNTSFNGHSGASSLPTVSGWGGSAGPWTGIWTGNPGETTVGTAVPTFAANNATISANSTSTSFTAAGCYPASSWLADVVVPTGAQLNIDCPVQTPASVNYAVYFRSLTMQSGSVLNITALGNTSSLTDAGMNLTIYTNAATVSPSLNMQGGGANTIVILNGSTGVVSPRCDSLQFVSHNDMALSGISGPDGQQSAANNGTLGTTGLSGQVTLTGPQPYQVSSTLSGAVPGGSPYFTALAYDGNVVLDKGTRIFGAVYAVNTTNNPAAGRVIANSNWSNGYIHYDQQLHNSTAAAQVVVLVDGYQRF